MVRIHRKTCKGKGGHRMFNLRHLHEYQRNQCEYHVMLQTPSLNHADWQHDYLAIILSEYLLYNYK